jgi:glutathione reductase (NADPH)
LNSGNTFDLIVIGTGTAASTVAHKCRSTGWSVAIIDSRPFGGTCALRGCEPKKVLVEAANVIDASRRHENKGIWGSKEIRIRWSDLMRFKETFTEPYPEHREKGYTKAGITSFHGLASFKDKNTINIEDYSNNKNKNSVLNGRFILIATGAKPVDLAIPGSENIITSDDFLDLKDELPEKVVFVGGGYISFEFAHIAARAGASVTILHRGKRPLEHFDPDLVDQLLKRTKEVGIDVKLGRAVKKVERCSSGRLVVYSSDVEDLPTAGGMSMTGIETGLIVHGAGREPNIQDLNLKAGGVDHTAKGIKVNQYLQSISNPHVYAAGDVADSGGPPLTPVATYEGNIVAANLIKGNMHQPNYTGIPSVVFTIPPLAAVGMGENEAKQKGLRFRTKYENTNEWASSRRVGENCSGFKVLVEEDSGQILGAHVLGPHAEEVINIFSMAIRLGHTSADLKDSLLYSYPTNSSDIVYMV